MNEPALLEGTTIAAPLQPKPAGTAVDVRHLIIGHCEGHPLQANGIYVVARQLIAEQLLAGHAARLYYLRRPQAERGPDAVDASVQLLPMTGRRVLGKLVQLDSAVIASLTQDVTPNTVVHIHGGREPLLLALTARLRKLGVPYAMTLHGKYSHLFDQENRPTKLVPVSYLKLLERHVLEHAIFVHAITAAEEEIVRAVAPRANCMQIPNGAYSSGRSGAPSPVARTPSDRFPRFGFCGRYEIHHKGLDLVLDGFAHYRRAGGKGSLEMIGTGPMRERLGEMAASLRIADHATIAGPRFGTEKARTFQHWDYFLMPSRFDVLPTAGLEAALTGLPLIASVATGFRPYLAKFGTGFTISSLSPEAISSALFEAERTPPDEWARMSRQSVQMALSIGDWTSIAARLVSLYGQRAAAPKDL